MAELAVRESCELGGAWVSGSLLTSKAQEQGPGVRAAAGILCPDPHVLSTLALWPLMT